MLIKVILDADPVRSPNLYFVQTIQLPIGIAAQRISVTNARRVVFDFWRIDGASFAIIATKAITTKGKLDSLVRYVAAIANPVSALSKKVGLFVRNHWRPQRDNAPKHTGDRTSLFMA